jgi:tetratricopeptide (TPR) repeat protein
VLSAIALFAGCAGPDPAPRAGSSPPQGGGPLAELARAFEAEPTAEGRARAVARTVHGKLGLERTMTCIEIATLLAGAGVGSVVRTPHHAVLQVEGEGGPVFLDPADPGAILTRERLERAHPWPKNERARRLYGRPIEDWRADLYANDAARAIEEGRPLDALRLARVAAEIEPDLPEALVNLAVALIALGRPGEAEPVLARAAEVLPLDPAILYNRAVAAATAGRRNEALRLYDETLRVDPGNERARANRAALLE